MVMLEALSELVITKHIKTQYGLRLSSVRLQVIL